MTMRRSHLDMSSIAHFANLSGNASPKNVMSKVRVCVLCVCVKFFVEIFDRKAATQSLASVRVISGWL